ncbi:MAG: biopolymer transporter ExbD [Planctomycetota bacterium]
MRRPTRRKSSLRPFDMTPMIDVVLQLIIFFMFTSQFGQIPRSEVDLPEEAGEGEVQRERPGLVIDLTAEGIFVVEARPMELERVARLAALEVERAGARPSGADILVRADRAAPVARLNELAERLSEAGVRRWRLGTSGAAGVGGDE